MNKKNARRARKNEDVKFERHIALGTGVIAKKIIPVIEASGGRVLVRKGVRRILLEGDSVAGVEMANGDKIWAPVVPAASSE